MKSSAGVAAKRSVEGHDHRPVEAGGGQEPQLVGQAGELEQRLLRPEKPARMRREGQRRRRPPERAGARQRRPDHGAVAAVDAVEIADRHHGAGKRPRVDRGPWPLRDMERLGRIVDLAHVRVFGSAETVIAAVVIMMRRSVQVSVSDLLTEFQINGLFKPGC